MILIPTYQFYRNFTQPFVINNQSSIYSTSIRPSIKSILLYTLFCINFKSCRIRFIVQRNECNPKIAPFLAIQFIFESKIIVSGIISIRFWIESIPRILFDIQNLAGRGTFVFSIRGIINGETYGMIPVATSKRNIPKRSRSMTVRVLHVDRLAGVHVISIEIRVFDRADKAQQIIFCCKSNGRHSVARNVHIDPNCSRFHNEFRNLNPYELRTIGIGQPIVLLRATGEYRSCQ